MCGSGPGLAQMVQQTECPIFLPFVSCFGPELFVTPARLAQVQNLPCSSGGTRCFTLHRGWRTDLPTSMLSGCAFFSVSSNSSKISLEQRERPTVKLGYNNNNKWDMRQPWGNQQLDLIHKLKHHESCHRKVSLSGISKQGSWNPTALLKDLLQWIRSVVSLKEQ